MIAATTRHDRFGLNWSPFLDSHCAFKVDPVRGTRVDGLMLCSFSRTMLSRLHDPVPACFPLYTASSRSNKSMEFPPIPTTAANRCRNARKRLRSCSTSSWRPEKRERKAIVSARSFLRLWRRVSGVVVHFDFLLRLDDLSPVGECAAAESDSMIPSSSPRHLPKSASSNVKKLAKEQSYNAISTHCLGWTGCR